MKRYLGMVLLCGLALGQQSEPYKDPSLPPHERSLDLLGRMNLEEKVAQMWQPIPDEVRVDGKLDPNKAREVVALRGAGSFLSLSGDDTVALQEIARKETRLGIPLLFGTDAIHGHAFFPRGTIFPMPLALSTSWNPELIQETTALTARELRASGVHWDFAPILDVARDPRFGWWKASVKIHIWWEFWARRLFVAIKLPKTTFGLWPPPSTSWVTPKLWVAGIIRPPISRSVPCKRFSCPLSKMR